MQIGVIGLGYVGLASALLLANSHHVIGYDIDIHKIDALKRKFSPINDTEIREYLLNTKNISNCTWTTNFNELLQCNLLIIAVPTNYDESTCQLDTSVIGSVIQKVYDKSKGDAPIILIKSTVPIGYTKSLQEQYCTDRIIFSPEFLREGKALHDNWYPSRIVVGSKTSYGQEIADLFTNIAVDRDVPVLLTGPSEAEAIKLFSNAYLAMRVAFFNELDNFTYYTRLNTKAVVKGVSYDPRIGDYYNNPSFGYGGYCLPKDTKQLQYHFDSIPCDIIPAIVKANVTRKQHIAKEIIKLRLKSIGIYRLSMKLKSSNFRQSPVHDIIHRLLDSGLSVTIYEPMLGENIFNGVTVISDFDVFVESCDIILANRVEPELTPYVHKVFSRDIFNND